MSELAAIDRADVGREAWDAFVDASPEAWLWHRYDLCEALGHWDHSADASFALREDGRLVAVMPLRAITYRRLRLLDACDVESLGGPAVLEGLGRRLAARVREAAILEARERATGTPMELRVVLPPLAPALRGDDAPRVNPLLELGLENTLTQTWVVDLRPGTDALWEGLEGRARTAVRKAERVGIQVRDARPDTADLDAYEQLHLATCARTGAQPHPRAYFEAIWAHFLSAGLAWILLAEHDGAVVAARNFGVYKGAALTWTAAGLDEAGPLGANAMLQWEAMRRLAAEGVEWCETGESFPNAADAKQRGLSEFKRSFGGDLRPFYRGRMDLRPKALRRLDALRS
jgi:hypothetical protein